MGDPDRGRIWGLFLIGCLAGLSTYVLTPVAQADQVMLATDVYRHAVESWLAGEGLYGVHPPDRPGYTFLYPPIAVLAFLPHAYLPSLTAAFVLQTAINAVVAVATAAVVHRGLRDRDVDVGRWDFAVISAFMLLSRYSAIQFLNGQITLWLALAIAVGFHLTERHREDLAGAAFALAALFKVFPAVLGLWLVRRRAWRGVAVAVGTGIAGLVLGAILLGPDLTATYLVEVLPGRFAGSTYAGRPDPGDNVDGIHRQLAALWPAGEDRLRTPLAFAVIAPLTTLSALRVDSTVRRDVAGLGIVVSILLFLPLQPLYFPLLVFPLVMLLYTLPSGQPRRILLVGTLLSFIHLDQESIVTTLELVRAPTGLVELALAVTQPLFTFVLPPTLGLWLMLGACVLFQLPPMGWELEDRATVARQ